MSNAANPFHPEIELQIETDIIRAKPERCDVCGQMSVCNIWACRLPDGDTRKRYFTWRNQKGFLLHVCRECHRDIPYEVLPIFGLSNDPVVYHGYNPENGVSDAV